jgi:serine/threonine protein kinase
MAHEEDLLLARKLVEAGSITKEQLSQCLKVVDQREVLGIRKPLREVVVELGLLSAGDVEGAAPSAAEPAPAAGEPAAAGGRNDTREVGGFRLIRQIGSGVVGTVWEAEQISLGKRVAVKILKPDLAKDQELIGRFVREAQSAARLTQPNIVQAIAAGEDNGVYYFAMEYLEGRNLRELLAEEGQLPEKRALEIARNVAEGLAAAAAQGFVHGDIKPANIMVTPEGEVKIADFGLARPHTETQPEGGTPHYMSPEQVTGKGPVDARSDIYALGATLFHLLAGRPPFEGSTVKEILLARLTQPVPDLRALRKDVRPQTAALVRKLLARDVAKRIQSPQEVVEILTKLSAPGPAPAAGTAAAPSARPPAKRTPVPGRVRAATRGTTRRGRAKVKTSRPPRELPSRGRGTKAPPTHSAYEDDLEEEEVRAPVRGGDHTYLYAGLGFGVVISLIVVALMYRGESKQAIQKRAEYKETTTKKADQQELREKFRRELAQMEEKATEAFTRIRGNADLDRETRLDSYGRFLKTYATAKKVHEIAAAYDSVRGQAATAANTELEERFGKARMLLSEGKPYEANEFLADQFSMEEQEQLGSRYQQLIEECSRTIDAIYAETETKARQLAAEKKFDALKEIIAVARRKVDPATQRKLLDLQTELTEDY